MRAFEYGIICGVSDEKELIKNINAFMVELGFRKIYKKAPSGVRDPDNPGQEPQYAHYYWQMLKQDPGWYFDLYPNQDLNGKYRIADAPDVGWTLYLSFTKDDANTQEQKQELDRFAESLIKKLGFSSRLLHAYQSGENRL